MGHEGQKTTVAFGEGVIASTGAVAMGNYSQTNGG